MTYTDSREEDSQEPLLPPIIPNSWHYSGQFLMCDREIADNPIILTQGGERQSIVCPICYSLSTIRLPIWHRQHPFHLYCDSCGLVWLPYPARCLNCGMFVEKHDDILACPKCGEWDEGIIRRAHELGDIELEGEL